jgi:UDP-N-acetylglucosamine:LPS N-acetylglucosamine transferase
LPRTPSRSPDKQLNVRPDVLAFAAVPPRILILTASVGEGHDLPARTLAAQLREEQPGVELVTEDCLVAMGRAVAAVSEGAARVVFYRFEWLWDIGFWLFAGAAPTRELSQRLITRFGSPGLLRLIERHDPDVIVSVYPNVTEVLGCAFPSWRRSPISPRCTTGRARASTYIS